MKHPPGTILGDGDRTVYTVLDGGWSNARFAFQPARKTYFNYRHADRSLIATEEDEAPAVLLRVPLGNKSEESLDFELDRVLSLPHAGWYPEPMDRLAAGTLVLAMPSGRRPIERPERDDFMIVRFLGEMLASYELLHQSNGIRGDLDPNDFFLDDSGRWTDLGTDLVVEAPDRSAFRLDLKRWAGFAERLLGPDFDPKAAGLPRDSAWIAERFLAYRR